MKKIIIPREKINRIAVYISFTDGRAVYEHHIVNAIEFVEITDKFVTVRLIKGLIGAPTIHAKADVNMYRRKSHMIGIVGHDGSVIVVGPDSIDHFGKEEIDQEAQRRKDNGED